VGGDGSHQRRARGLRVGANGGGGGGDLHPRGAFSFPVTQEPGARGGPLGAQGGGGGRAPGWGAFARRRPRVSQSGGGGREGPGQLFLGQEGIKRKKEKNQSRRPSQKGDWEDGGFSGWHWGFPDFRDLFSNGEGFSSFLFFGGGHLFGVYIYLTTFPGAWGGAHGLSAERTVVWTWV